MRKLRWYSKKLIEVVGKEINILNINTSNTPVQVEIDMWEIFYHIKAGCRLRLDVSSSDFPQYSIHSNFKGKWALQEK